MAENEKQEVLEELECFINGDIKIDGIRTNDPCGIGCEAGCLASCMSSLYGVQQEKRG